MIWFGGKKRKFPFIGKRTWVVGQRSIRRKQRHVSDEFYKSNNNMLLIRLASGLQKNNGSSLLLLNIRKSQLLFKAEGCFIKVSTYCPIISFEKIHSPHVLSYSFVLIFHTFSFYGSAFYLCRYSDYCSAVNSYISSIIPFQKYNKTCSLIINKLEATLAGVCTNK